MNEMEGKCTKSSKDLSNVESHLQDTQVQKRTLSLSHPTCSEMLKDSL